MSEPPKKNFFCPDNIFQDTPLPMLKILLPFLPLSSQKFMAIFLKFLELKYTMDFFNRGNFFCSLTDSVDSSDPSEMLSVLKEVFPKEQQENIDNMFQMVQAMEMMQFFQEEASPQKEFPQNSFSTPDTEENTSGKPSENEPCPEKDSPPEIFSSDSADAGPIDYEQ